MRSTWLLTLPCSVFNLAFCHQLSWSMIARLHTLDVLAGIEETKTCSHPFRHPRGSLRKFIRRLRLNIRQLLQTWNKKRQQRWGGDEPPVWSGYVTGGLEVIRSFFHLRLDKPRLCWQTRFKQVIPSVMAAGSFHQNTTETRSKHLPGQTHWQTFFSIYRHTHVTTIKSLS